MYHRLLSLSVSVAFLVTALAPRCAFSLEPEQIWERVSPTVFRIEATLLDGDQMQGSGFVCEIEGKKYVLSNRHVVIGAKQVRVGPSAGKLTIAPGYRISPELDLALIDLPQQLQIPALQKRATGLKTGERVYAIGFPLGLEKSITQGLLSSQTEKVIQFDAPISSGSSGGPLVDKDGLVVGVVTAGSIGSGKEVVQNLNFAIKTAFIPKLSLFRDPVISFYDAWRELVNFERTLIDELDSIKAVECHQYLMREWVVALPLTSGHLTVEQRAEFASGQAELLKTITARHATLGKASEAVLKYLGQTKDRLDKVPDLFIGLGNQELVNQFVKDTRPGRLFRLNIEPDQIVPLLKRSIEHAKAHYEDIAYQIGFLTKNLPRFQARDEAIVNLMQTTLKDMEKAQRESVRLPYEVLKRDPSSAGQIRLFVWTLRPTEPKIPDFDPNKPATLVADEVLPELQSFQHFSRSGGFESEVIEMFQRLAIEQMQKKNSDKALGYIRNEVAVKKDPDFRLYAHFTACNGDFERAYSLYEKAVTESTHRINPFKIAFRSGAFTRHAAFDELLDDGTSFFKYSEAAQQNLREFHSFILKKPWFGLTSLPTPQEVFESQSFKSLNEFEQMAVVFQLLQFDLKQPSSTWAAAQAAVQKAIKENATAKRALDRLYED